VTVSASGAVPGPDGGLRCPWGVSTPDYLAYHDDEWGRPVRGERGVFERLTLEAFQSGLSWLTILRKRPAFRRAFDDFDAAAIAAYDSSDVTRLLADASIVRNRAKIEATIANAHAVLALEEGLHSLVWRHAPARHPAPISIADVPAVTTESTALAKALRANGFRFVGPTTSYALMQAVGVVNDHLLDCVARAD